MNASEEITMKVLLVLVPIASFVFRLVMASGESEMARERTTPVDGLSMEPSRGMSCAVPSLLRLNRDTLSVLALIGSEKVRMTSLVSKLSTNRATSGGVVSAITSEACSTVATIWLFDTSVIEAVARLR